MESTFHLNVQWDRMEEYGLIHHQPLTPLPLLMQLQTLNTWLMIRYRQWLNNLWEAYRLRQYSQRYRLLILGSLLCPILITKDGWMLTKSFFIFYGLQWSWGPKCNSKISASLTQPRIYLGAKIKSFLVGQSGCKNRIDDKTWAQHVLHSSRLIYITELM